MRRLFGACIAGALTAMALGGAQAASAATEVGSNCTANSGVLNYTLVQLGTAPGHPLPLSVPQAGILTKWKVSSGVPLPPELQARERLRVFRSTGTTNQFRVVAETGDSAISTGSNTFDARIPVEAGDRVGAFAPSGMVILFCSTANAADVLGAKPGDVPLGTQADFAPAAGLQLALSAVIEPDADGDGYGDESQDKCPQSAAVQVPCPAVALSTSSIVKKGLVRVLVTSNVQAAVTVGGTVKLGKGKTAKLSGGTQVILPGAISKFTLIFPASLKEKLKGLSRKQSLTLQLSATAPNVVGAPSVSSSKVKLKGQKKPKKLHRPKGGK